MVTVPLRDGKRCPKCRSTLFHAKQEGSAIVLRCWKKDCGWSMVLQEENE